MSERECAVIVKSIFDLRPERPSRRAWRVVAWRQSLSLRYADHMTTSRGGQGPVSRKPRKLFGPVFFFIFKLLEWREPLSILRICEQLCKRKVRDFDMALRARKGYWAFEKRAPESAAGAGHIWPWSLAKTSIFFKNTENTNWIPGTELFWNYAGFFCFQCQKARIMPAVLNWNESLK